jgi:hypothetical protein
MAGLLKGRVGEMGVAFSVGVGDGSCGVGAFETAVGLTEVGLGGSGEATGVTGRLQPARTSVTAAPNITNGKLFSFTISLP